MKEQIEKVIGELIRPALQRDGGDIELVEVRENGQIVVKLRGACAGCPGAAMTLKMGVERILKEKVPGVKEVIAMPAFASSCGA